MWITENNICLYFIYNYMNNNSKKDCLNHDTHSTNMKLKNDTINIDYSPAASYPTQY